MQRIASETASLMSLLSAQFALGSPLQKIGFLADLVRLRSVLHTKAIDIRFRTGLALGYFLDDVCAAGDVTGSCATVPARKVLDLGPIQPGFLRRL
jgi:hypothetical protein